jgi:hypothetical protein
VVLCWGIAGREGIESSPVATSNRPQTLESLLKVSLEDEEKAAKFFKHPVSDPQLHQAISFSRGLFWGDLVTLIGDCSIGFRKWWFSVGGLYPIDQF